MVRVGTEFLLHAVVGVVGEPGAVVDDAQTVFIQIQPVVGLCIYYRLLGDGDLRQSEVCLYKGDASALAVHLVEIRLIGYVADGDDVGTLHVVYHAVEVGDADELCVGSEHRHVGHRLAVFIDCLNTLS